MFGVHLLAYPWDLLEEGASQRLERLRGDIGVEGISLWMVCPPVSELRPRPTGPRTLVSRGGFLFQPSDRHFHALRCPPVVSSWLRTGHPLAEVGQRCREHGLTVRAVVCAARMGLMAERFPELSNRNAFGDESRSSICLSHADVQAILRAALGQLSASEGVTAVVVTDLQIRWSEAHSAELRLPAELGAGERSLLGVCFCDCCMRAADGRGSDAAAARAEARRILTSALWGSGGSGAAPFDFLRGSRTLQEYVQCSRETLEAVVQGLKVVAQCPLLIDGGGAALPTSVGRVADGVLYEEQDGSVAGEGPPAGGELRIVAEQLLGDRGGRLIGRLSERAQQGVTGLTVDHFGLLTDQHLDVLRQATRFARRSAGL